MTAHADLKMLIRARMVATGESYTAARDRLVGWPADRDPTATAAAREQRRLVARWFVDGRLRSIPARRKVRAAVLLELLTRFTPARDYPEAEVNRVLATAHPDVAYLRRELVAFGYLSRSEQIYRVCAEPPERTMRQRSELPAWERFWLADFTAVPDVR